MSRVDAEVFQVDPWTDRIGAMAERHRPLLRWLGNVETRMLDRPLKAVQIDRPIYVAGLPRAGSTLLLELLGRHPSVVTHRYRDFPLLHVPWFWNQFLDRAVRKTAPPTERSHRDGMLVDAQSPEAFEEVLWMSFFPSLHDPSRSEVLDGDARHPKFEAFYRDHIRKLLLLRDGTRYLAKGNYNVTRLEYLQRVFPDARFVVPVRDPVWQIASLMKQHALFCAGEQREPRARAHLERVGHFEFGVQRRPVNAGDSKTVRRIADLWAQGAEVDGWARYWQHIYGYLADRLQANEHLRAATLVLPYERLCDRPHETLAALFDHCGLDIEAALLEDLAERVRFPTYYAPQFEERELWLIEHWTAATAARLGLGAPADAPREASIGVRLPIAAKFAQRPHAVT